MELHNEFILLIGVVDIEIEPFIELLGIRKHVWNKKVKKCPSAEYRRVESLGQGHSSVEYGLIYLQFVKIVLKRRPCQQQAITSLKTSYCG